MFVESTFPQNPQRQICTTLNELSWKQYSFPDKDSRCKPAAPTLSPHGPLKVKSTNPHPRHPVDVLCPRKNPTSMLALRATRLRPHNPHQSHKKVEQYPSALQGGAFFLPRAKETFSFTPLGSPSDPPCSKPKRSGGFLRITQKRKSNVTKAVG